MANEIACPVDFIIVNENKVRLTALQVFLLAVAYFFTGAWIIPSFLIIDFFLRGFKLGKYSLLNLMSDQLVKAFSIPVKPIDQAPKRFAAKIGFLFSIAITALQLTGNTVAALILAAVLTFFAFLESFFSFCAGCYVYTFWAKLSRTGKGIAN